MPGTTYSYNTLIAEIQSWAEDQSAQFVAEVPNIVSLGESRLVTDLDLEIFHNTNAGALTIGVFAQTMKSAGWCGTRSVWLRDVGGAGPYVQIFRRTIEYCITYAPDPATGRARPTYFGELSPTQLHLAAAPDVAYGFEVREVALLAAQRLTSGNQNTWLGTNAGDMLLKACLMEAQVFLKAVPDDISIVEKSYQSLLMPRKFELRRVARADYTPIENAAEPKR